MKKIGSFSPNRLISRNTGTETMNKQVDSADIRQKMIADDDHYHAEKLGFGHQGAHEGWIKAEEAGAAAKAAVNADTRQEIIAVAAYYLAEKRELGRDGAYEDWIKAEAEIDAMLNDPYRKVVVAVTRHH